MQLEYNDGDLILTTEEGKQFKYKGVPNSVYNRMRNSKDPSDAFEEYIAGEFEKEKVKGMLSEDEIKQLHNNFIVRRKEEIFGVPFVIKNLSFAEETEFTKLYNGLKNISNERFNNLNVTETLKYCLESFNGKPVTGEMINKFSAEKANFILQKYSNLIDDITGYLSDYPTQELVKEEVEEFILTDHIERKEKFNYSEDIPPLEFSYRILNMEDYNNVAQKVEDVMSNFEGELSQAHAGVLREREFAKEIIKTDMSDLEFMGIELVRLILQRAEGLQKQIIEMLNDPEAMGENLKN